MSAPGHVAVLLDGVTYLHGHRDPVHTVTESQDDPGPAAAERALRETIARLEGAHARLRAGFAAVRWCRLPREPEGGAREGAGDAGAWVGPAYLFSFEARVAGTFEVALAGEDPGDDWAPPASA